MRKVRVSNPVKSMDGGFTWGIHRKELCVQAERRGPRALYPMSRMVVLSAEGFCDAGSGQVEGAAAFEGSLWVA